MRRFSFSAMFIFLIAIVFSWAFFQPTFFRVHDFTHVARLVELRRALDGGQFPVHWTQNFGYGYGMPLFLFYGPLPTYFGALLNFIGVSPVWSVKLTFAATGLLVTSGMYVFLRRWGKIGALSGTTLLLAAPYRAVDIFVRGALSEVFAIGILPWLLDGLWRIHENPRLGFLLTSFWTAALIITHNLTALMALPILYTLAFFSIVWRKKQWKRNFLLLIAAGTTGVLAGVFYAIPAFLEKNQTIIGDILSGYFDYHLHFLYIRQLILPRWGYGGSEFGPNDGISFHLGFPLFFAIAMAGAGLLIKRLKKEKRFALPSEAEVLFLLFGLAAGFSLFLTLSHSLLLWENIPLLPFIQFPWRFLGLAIVLLSAAAGIGLSQFRPSLWRFGIFLVLITSIIIGQLKYHRPEKFLPEDDGYYYTDPERIRIQMSDILPDYIPAGFDRKLPPVAENQRILISPEPTKTSWELNRSHELLLFAEAPKKAEIIWKIADFPGWHYYVNNIEVSPEKLPDGRRRFISQDPVSSIGAQFSLTPLRSGTLAISLATWIGLAALALRTKKHE